MVPASPMFLLLLCTFLTEVHQTSGAAIRKPEGKCPAVLNVRCADSPGDLCSSDSECKWNEMCCSNGCQKLCMKVSAGAPSYSIPPFLEPLKPPAKPEDLFPDHPIFGNPPDSGPFFPPAKPKNPFPDFPDNRHPPPYNPPPYNPLPYDHRPYNPPPYNPRPYNPRPYNPPPYNPPQPDLPPIPVVPLDPLNYMHDVNPFPYGREDYFK